MWPDDVAVVDDPTRPWWPHPALVPSAIAALAPTVDAVHLHFGYEHRSVAELIDWCETLRRHHLPLVVTVHDIDHPHLADRAHHRRHLDVVVPAADAVITLTEGAARWLRRRYRRAVTVIPHPPLLNRCPSGVARRTVLGIDLRPARAGLLDPVLVVAAVARAARTVGVAVQVLARPSQVDELLTAGRKAMTLGTDAASDGGAQAIEAEQAATGFEVVAVGDDLSDDGFARWHAGWDAVVLAYRHGTHSGRVELCRDLGTKVLATDRGYLRHQWPAVETVAVDAFAVPGDIRLIDAIAAVMTRPRPRPRTEAERRALTADIQNAHREVLASVIERDRVVVAP